MTTFSRQTQADRVAQFVKQRNAQLALEQKNLANLFLSSEYRTAYFNEVTHDKAQEVLERVAVKANIGIFATETYYGCKMVLPSTAEDW
jgi:hypothetical protein